MGKRKTSLRISLEIALRDYGDTDDFGKAIEFLDFAAGCARIGIDLKAMPSHRTESYLQEFFRRVSGKAGGAYS